MDPVTLGRSRRETTAVTPGMDFDGLAPLRDIEYLSNVARTPRRVLSDGLLYGSTRTPDGDPLELRSSDDLGDTWSAPIHTFADGAAITAIRETNDGEVLISLGDRVVKSDGWSDDPATATWSEKLTAIGNANAFREWGLKTYAGHDVVVASEYDTTYAEGSEAWVSYDNGDTFTSIFSARQWEHVHCVEWDRYLFEQRGVNRIYLAKHGQTATGPEDVNSWAGTFYTDDDGGAWTRIPFVDRWVTTSGLHEGRDPDATTIDAMRDGIILGSDWWPNGVWRIPRVDPGHPRFRVEPILTWSAEPSLAGVARTSIEHDGMLYIGFSRNPDGSWLAASDGRRAWLLWNSTQTTFEGPVGVSDGKLIIDRGRYTSRAPLPAFQDLSWHAQRRAPDGRDLFFANSVWLPATAFTATFGTPTLTHVNRIPVWSLDADTQAYLSAVLIPEVLGVQDWSSFHIDVHVVNLGSGEGNIRFRHESVFLEDGNAIEQPSITNADAFAAGAQNALQVQRITSSARPMGEGVWRFVLDAQRSSAFDTLANAVGLVGVRLVRAS